MERYDVVVIGAGPSGSAAALSLSRAGFNVLVVERGKTVGSKNVFGGRIYSYPLFDLLPDWQNDCPVERYVIKDVLVLMTEGQSLQLQFESPQLASGRASSFTATRPLFDGWLAKKAEEAGATLITGIRIDDLWLESGRVKGVVAGSDHIGADVVVAADGVVSKFTQRVGLRFETTPEMVSVGVKETIALSPSTIQDRFNLGEQEGAAFVMVGHASGGMGGGGFLYTNRESVSLGIVIPSIDLSLKGVEINDIQEGLKRHPMLKKILSGGKVIEYSTHMIPELGIRTLRRTYSDNFLAVGDAAGFLINNGYTFRGVDLAIASGMAAADTIKVARDSGDYSVTSMSSFERLMQRNKVLTDLQTFWRGPLYMRNPRLFTLYPKLVCDIAERIYSIDGQGKDRIVDTMIRELKRKNVSLVSLLRDLYGGARSM